METLTTMLFATASFSKIILIASVVVLLLGGFFLGKWYATPSKGVKYGLFKIYRSERNFLMVSSVGEGSTPFVMEITTEQRYNIQWNSRWVEIIPNAYGKDRYVWSAEEPSKEVLSHYGVDVTA